MRIQRDFYTQAKRSSTGLRRGTVVSVVVHILLLGALAGTAYYMKSSSALNVIDVGVMFAGLPDAPEGGESTRVADLPPGIPESKPAPPPKKATPEKKPDPPAPAVKPPEPEPEKKVEPKKPDPAKEAEKKTLIAKEEKLEKEPPKPKDEPKEEPKKEKPEKEAKKFEKGDALPDAGIDNLLEEEREGEILASAGTPGAGGLEGARPSDKAQTFLGDPLSKETGISVPGLPGILGSWANQVRRAVKRCWREPGGMPIGSRTAISFWVSSDGQLLGEPEVKEPSNDASLDLSAINAVKLAAPFPPLPPGYNEPRQQVIFVFTISS